MLAPEKRYKILLERIFNLKIMGPALQTVIIVICIIFSAYFSATETAFSTFNRIRMKNMAEKGNKKAARVLALSDNYDTLISTILIGNNLVNILSTSLATILFIDICKDSSLGSTVSTVVMTVVVLMFESGADDQSRQSAARQQATASAILESRRHPGARQQRAAAKNALVQGPQGRGRFNNVAPTIWRGTDIDVPTYLRQGITLEF